ncbi:MAG: signal recognition particle protein [Acidimicrobiia bacterium]|jgi:signal recognition particle subunit SRP54|nr:signal recognition particle protein [Acidimicrobiia bacterium]
MFDALSSRFDGIFARLKSRGKLTEADVDEAMREIRLALLEADVNFRVVKSFVRRVRDRAMGEDVAASLTPGQMVVKIVHEELIATLGGSTGTISVNPKPPTVIMMAGLQGAGKTTAVGKLARLLKSQGHQPLLVGADLQRPAAVEQLRTLGRQVDVPVFSEATDPVSVARSARAKAAELGRNIVIVDTAGRLAIDAELMEELAQVKAVVQPDTTLLVIDSMIGQEAVATAEAFHETVPIDGVILTKIDGDARGGAALSVKEVLDRPIMYVGTGEKLEDFETFHPDRMASRILGMGDVLTLIEKAEASYDIDVATRAEQRLREGQFTLEDFLEQMQQIKKMGSLNKIVGLLPGVPKEIKNAQIDDRELARVEAIIHSMTPEERRNPNLINGSRRLRIARGAGMRTSDVNALLKQFKMMQQMMSQMSRGKRPKLPFGQLPGM